jgi:hypothetical protein
MKQEQGRASRVVKEVLERQHMSSGKSIVGVHLLFTPILWVFTNLLPCVFFSFFSALFVNTLLLEQYFKGLKGIKGVFEIEVSSLGFRLVS